MDFNQVRYFLALSETLNFSRAAEQCHVTQPALTQGIKRLEEELGGPLLIRDRKETCLTPLGQSLRSHFENINNTRNLVRKTAKAITSGVQNDINIGLMCTIGPSGIARMLNSSPTAIDGTSLILHDTTPDATPNLLLSGALDLAFCSSYEEKHPQLEYISLFIEPMVVAFHADHRFSKYESIPLNEVSKENYIDRLHCEFRSGTMSMFTQKKLPLNVTFSSQREDWIQGIIRSGNGVTIMPQYKISEPDIEFRPLAPNQVSREVQIAYAGSSNHSPSVQKLLAHAKEYSNGNS